MTKRLCHYKIHPVKVTGKVTEYRGYIYDDNDKLRYTTELYLNPAECENMTLEIITAIENHILNVEVEE